MAKTMTTQEILALNCKRLRKAAGLTQTECAKKATQHRSAMSAAKASDEINQRTVGRLESPTGNPTIATIDAVASVFSLAAWQLMVPENVSNLNAERLSPKVKQITEIATRLNDDGLTALLGASEVFAADKKYTKHKPRKSSA